MKTDFFLEKLGSRSKTWGKRLCFGRESPFFFVFLETMKERGSMYEYFPLCGSTRAAIPGRLLTKKLSNKNRFSEKKIFFDFVGRCFLVFSKRFRWVCKDFGSESWRKMMPRGQLSHPSKQINSNSIKLISFTRISRICFPENNIIINIYIPIDPSLLSAMQAVT